MPHKHCASPAQPTVARSLPPSLSPSTHTLSLSLSLSLLQSVDFGPGLPRHELVPQREQHGERRKDGPVQHRHLQPAPLGAPHRVHLPFERQRVLQERLCARLNLVAQAQTTGWFKLKALLSFSQSNFEAGRFQAGVELAPPPHLKLREVRHRLREAQLARVVGGES